MDIDSVLRLEYLVISVAGPYAGEPEKDILPRKRREIEACGFTFWHHQSYKAKPDAVQTLGAKAKSEGEPLYFLLIESSSNRGGLDTKKSPQAKEYAESENGHFTPIPQGIYVEIGKKPYALKLKSLTTGIGSIDLCDYSFLDGSPLRILQGGSTLCVKKEQPKSSCKMISHRRGLIVYAEVPSPFSVWLR